LDVIGDRIYAGTKEKKVFVWDTKTMTLLYSWRADPRAVMGIRVFGGCVYTAGSDGLKQWTASGKLLYAAPARDICSMFVHLPTFRIYTVDWTLSVVVTDFRVEILIYFC
jgi:predicted lipoprotein with Yx(FWY)xxD motif